MSQCRVADTIFDENGRVDSDRLLEKLRTLTGDDGKVASEEFLWFMLEICVASWNCQADRVAQLRREQQDLVHDLCALRSAVASALSPKNFGEPTPIRKERALRQLRAALEAERQRRCPPDSPEAQSSTISETDQHSLSD